MSNLEQIPSGLEDLLRKETNIENIEEFSRLLQTLDKDKTQSLLKHIENVGLLRLLWNFLLRWYSKFSLLINSLLASIPVTYILLSFVFTVSNMNQNIELMKVSYSQFIQSLNKIEVMETKVNKMENILVERSNLFSAIMLNQQKILNESEQTYESAKITEKSLVHRDLSFDKISTQQEIFMTNQQNIIKNQDRLIENMDAMTSNLSELQNAMVENQSEIKEKISDFIDQFLLINLKNISDEKTDLDSRRAQEIKDNIKQLDEANEREEKVFQGNE